MCFLPDIFVCVLPDIVYCVFLPDIVFYVFCQTFFVFAAISFAISCHAAADNAEWLQLILNNTRKDPHYLLQPETERVASLREIGFCLLFHFR